MPASATNALKAGQTEFVEIAALLNRCLVLLEQVNSSVRVRAHLTHPGITPIANAICERYNLTLAELRSPCRERYYSDARAELAYLAHQKGITYSQIDRFLHRKHGAAHHGARLHAALQAKYVENKKKNAKEKS